MFLLIFFICILKMSSIEIICLMIDEYHSDKKMPAKRKMKNYECNKVLKVKGKENVLKKTKYVNKKRKM